MNGAAAQPAPGDALAELPVLVVGNQRADVEIVAAQLHGAFRRVFPATSIEQGARLLTHYQPRVLLLCFDPCTSTENGYRQLLELASLEKALNHQSMVLCDASEIRHALHLAMDGIVDDAVVFRPVQTPEHLQLRVRLAMRRWETLSRLDRLSAIVTSMQGSAGALDALWHATLERGTALGAQTQVEQARLVERIGAAVRLLAGASAPLATGAGTGTGDAGIDQALAAFDASVAHGLAQWRTGLEDGYRSHVRPLQDQARAGARTSATILVVDDDPMVLQTLAAILELEGYCVVTQSDGANVLATALRLRPTLVLMDINLAGEDGLDLTRQIKAHPLLSEVPVWVISGLGFGEVVRRSRAVGADSFILKPIEIAALRRKLAALVQGAARAPAAK